MPDFNIIRSFVDRYRSSFTCEEEVGEYSSGFLPRMVRKTVRDFCISGKGRLLEVGSGEGLFLVDLSRANPHIFMVGIDPWLDIIKESKKRIFRGRHENIELVSALGQVLPFGDEEFDYVVCINLLLNLPDILEVQSTIEEIVRVCKSDGRFYFDFRNKLNPLINLGYRLVRFHDPEIKVPVRSYFISDIKRILWRLKVQKFEFRGLAFPLAQIAPAVLVSGMK
ncbi:MAG: class I SAM-dependent methyltransferase [Fidelibacterota bacterium]